MGGCAAGNGADTIVRPGGSYSLTSVNNDTGSNLTGLPVITIAGNGATIARASGAPAFRIFQMGVPFFTPGDLTLNDTTSTGGHLGSGRQGAASTTLAR